MRNSTYTTQSLRNSIWGSTTNNWWNGILSVCSELELLYGIMELNIEFIPIGLFVDPIENNAPMDKTVETVIFRRRKF